MFSIPFPEKSLPLVDYCIPICYSLYIRFPSRQVSRTSFIASKDGWVDGGTVMKIRIRILPLVFGLLGVLTAATAITAAFRSLNAPPYLLEAPESASDCAEGLMQCVCQGNYQQAEKYLQGAPDLELNRSPQDPVGVLLWDAYTSSSSYTLVGELYATETGLAQDVRFRALDLDAVMKSMDTLSKELFTSGIESAEDPSAVYDREGNYRDDFIQNTLLSAARQALADDSHMTETELTLHLTHQDGQWLVIADQALLQIICGGVTG